MTACERVEAEFNELRTRIKKLEDFAAALLQTQCYLINAYAETSEARLEFWKE